MRSGAANLGASQIVEVNIRTGRVVRTIPGLPRSTGSWWSLRCTASTRLPPAPAGLSGSMRTPAQSWAGPRPGPTPMGWPTTRPTARSGSPTKSGGSETIIDAATGAPRGTVRLDGDVGNVAYDPISGRMLVDVQGRNQLAVIDPATRAVIRRVPLPGCSDDHGLSLDSAAGWRSSPATSTRPCSPST